MLKILMALDREFPPDIRVENEIEALSRAGHQVHIACYTRKNKPPLENLPRVTVHRKPISPFVYRSSVAALTLPFYFRFWNRFLAEILTGNSFDVIHVHDLPLASVGIRFRESLKIRLVIDLHENWPAFLRISRHTNTLAGKLLSPVFLWRRYERKVLLRTDAVIVVVDEAKARLSRLGIEEGRVFVVSNTINLSEVRLPGHTGGKEVVLYYAGGINEHRGLQNVVLGMHRAGNERLRFWILGEGSYRKELESLVERFSLKDKVLFFGYLPFQKVMEMLAQADFAIIPHLRSEHTDTTVPHKLFQYMYAGKPVIAGNCLPLERILQETGAGITYPPTDTRRLGEILAALDQLDRDDMAARGKKAVIEKYNWDRDAQVLLNLYSQFSAIRSCS